MESSSGVARSDLQISSSAPLDFHDDIIIDDEKSSFLHETLHQSIDHDQNKYEQFAPETDGARRFFSRKHHPMLLDDEDESKILLEILGLRCRILPKEYDKFINGSLNVAAAKIKEEFSKVKFLSAMKKRAKICIRQFRRKRIFFDALASVVLKDFPWVLENLQCDVKGFKSGDKIESAEKGFSNEICTILEIYPGKVSMNSSTIHQHHSVGKNERLFICLFSYVTRRVRSDRDHSGS
jgi:hypothetical protein